MKQFITMVVVLTSLVLSSFAMQKKDNQPFDSYEKSWEIVGEFERVGQPQSALKEVNNILEQSEADANSPQLIKALLHKFKYTMVLEEDAELRIIETIDGYISKTTDEAAKSILHSVKAEALWDYYQSNRYKFLNRSAQTDLLKEDFRTWDLPSLMALIREHHFQALANPEVLQSQSIELYDAILLQQDESERYRPTLYDLLAHRAIDFFSMAESGLDQGIEIFSLDEPNYFSEAAAFVQIEFSGPPSMQRDILLVMQEVLKFHIQKNDTTALIDTDLKRLAYLQQHSNLDDKDNLYITALQQLSKENSNNPFSSYVNYKLADHWYRMSQQIESVPSKDENLRLKAQALCLETIDRFPRTFGAENCRALLQQIETRELTAETERVLLPGDHQKILVTYRNLDIAYFRLVRLSADEAATLYEGRQDRNKWARKLLDRTAYRQWNEKLTDPGDLYTHTTEVAMEGMEQGTYVLLTCMDPDFNGDVNIAGEIWVSRISYVTRQQTDGSLEVYIVDRGSGQPIEGAEVQAYRLEYDYTVRKNKKIALESARTGLDGRVEFRAPKENRGQQLTFSIRNGDDYLDVSPFLYLHHAREYESKWRQETYYFTDRSIYRPGQTIYFKGITIETNGSESRIVGDQRVDVEFRDVNYKEISRREFRTNEYGSFHGTFTAPMAGLMGRMTIQGGGGQGYVQVEEYKRPTFEVVLDPIEGSFSLGEDIVLTGKGMSYAGAPLSGSKVVYRVVREVRYPVWYGWGYYRMPPGRSTTKEIAFGETSTAQDGAFEISFTAEPDKSVPRKNNPRFHYTAYIDIVDISGETRSNSKSVTCGYTGLDLMLDVPDQIDRTVPGKIKVSTTNLDGQPSPSNVTINLYRIIGGDDLLRERLWDEPDIFQLSEERHGELFPHDHYRKVRLEDMKKELVKTYSFNTGEQSDLIIEAGLLEVSGQYWLDASSWDDAGQEVEFKKQFIAIHKNDERPPVPVHLGITLDKKVYAPGDIAEISISSSVEKAYLVYQQSFDGQVRKSQWIELSNEIRKLSIPIEESDRGDIAVQCAMVTKGRVYTQQVVIKVPFKSTDLQMEWMTFRDLLLPGQKEEWQLKIKGPDGGQVQAELLAAMYDKSLDYFQPHNYSFHPAAHPYVRKASAFAYAGNFQVAGQWTLRDKDRSKYIPITLPGYDQLNLFGFSMNAYSPIYMMRSEFSDRKVMYNRMEKGEAAPAAAGAVNEEMDGMGYAADQAEGGFADALLDEDDMAAEIERPQATDDIPLRENLDETAFFFPDLRTNEEGEVILAFEMPEALTTWKFLGLAHDPDLQSLVFTKEVRTQKDLMVTPNFPRFFRDGDKISVTAKIDNLTENDLSGSVTLVLKDALTGKVITDQLVEGNEQNIVFPAQASASVEWEIVVSDNFQAVTFEIFARSGDFTDGISNTLPVLTNRMLVTESMPVWLKGPGERTFTLEHLMDYSSTTLKHHQYTLEYASNPAWYAVQALPYLMEFPYECAEQLFSRYYANTLASHIANSNPAIRKIFDQWRTLDSDALLSNLEKNQELKALLIEETPWLRDARDESERKKRIALLFDLNRMASEKQVVLGKLKEMQTPNGGFSWFPGMRDNRYITQHILTGIAHLQQLGISEVSEDPIIREIVDKAIPYLDTRIAEDFRDIKKYDKEWKKNDHLGNIQIQYLYVRSYYRDYLLEDNEKAAADYFMEQAEKFWLSKNRFHQAMLSIGLHRYFRKATADQIIVSLKENAIVSDELGMYWKSVEQGGYYWYNAPIEAQAMLIEAFHTVADDAVSVNEMKVWLLKQKQVQDWKTTKATAEAVFALLLRGGDWLSGVEPATVKIGREVVDVKAMDGSYESGTGYFKVNWNASEIERSMAEVTVSSTNESPSWGAVYWQYFEQLDNIEGFEETPLKLSKKLFVERYTANGPVITPVADAGELESGDKLKVRIELTVDRTMEYVHMKDMRASGLEPVNVISSYKYQDGLGYYESTRDAATHFFFDYLPKGIYVFEYPLRVTHKGDFSNGITSIQSMYAPEFASHSEGVRVRVGED